MATEISTRSLVVWVPDWPVVALTRDGAHPLDPETPIAVVEKNLVVACSAAARRDGVRRGLRRRDAQGRCPALTIAPLDPVRDHRAFSPVVAQIEERVPGVQVMRPGLCALKARGPARYYGGESAASHVLLDRMRELGLDGARIGVADGPFTAEQAVRIATSADDPVRIVPEGAAAGFLAPLSVATLVDTDPDIVRLLSTLGVQSLGAFAAMPEERVRERLGERGVRLRALAAGLDSRAIEPRTPPPELSREIAFEPPLELADQVAFGVRQSADAFLSGLGAIDLVCTEVRIELVGDRGERSERVWLHPGSFDAAAIVDRVRWQLAEDAADLVTGVGLVRISPEAVDAASHHAPAIFGSGPEERVHHALSRVQAMLGHRGVLTPAIGGGRWLAERQVWVPWGDRLPKDARVLGAERARPWPGSLPDPLPTTVFADPVTVDVVSTSGVSVSVDERGQITGTPALLIEAGRRRAVTAWAGPWPIIERGWDPARSRRAHRFQIVDADCTAWLLVCERGSWHAEGRYD
ncbi:DNA polymerase Y family protein [Microbacterium sediminicola]|uniref:DNA polymerase Y family protein n=1 Tax=Microbacterium sediminicola TaxID=415210 RepID=A0ABP4U4P0_9MICO